MWSMYIIKMWVILESLVSSFTQDHKADLLTLLKKLKKRGISYKGFYPTLYS